jgi:hypothetical protein
MPDQKPHLSPPRPGRRRRVGTRRDLDPGAWLGHGIVSLVCDTSGDSYHCYWLVGPAEDHVVEQGTASSAAGAIEWARARTPRVRIRLPDHRTYWAGTDPDPGGFAGPWTAATDAPVRPLVTSSSEGQAPPALAQSA